MASKQALTHRLPDRSFSSSSCHYEKCWTTFTLDNKGQLCTGCRNAWYCNSVCQKADWKMHKSGCRAMQERRKLQSTDTPLQDRKPNIMQDLDHYLSAIGPTLKAGTRSAMRIGHPDSLAKDHWLNLVLTYTPPPIERWSKTGDKPKYDEHEFFTVRGFAPRPDSLLDEEKPLGIDAAEKKKTCAEMAPLDPLLPGGHTAVLLVVAALMADDPEGEEGTAVTGLYVDMPHTSRFFPPLAERALHPQPALLFPITISHSPKNNQELKEQIMLVNYLDLAMSETPEYLAALSYGPEEGWKVMQRRLQAMIRETMKSNPPKLLPYRSLK